MTDTLPAAVSHKIKVGDLVLVSYPIGEQTNNPARILNGLQFIVKSKHQVDAQKNTRVSKHYFELCGAVSKMGVPYAFLEDELIKL